MIALDARDCARAIVHALNAEAPETGVYSVAAALAVSLDQFVETFRNEIGALEVEIPVKPETGFAGFPFVRPAPSSIDRAEKEIGFEPVFSLAGSIRYWANPSSE